jgi:NADH-quinone oxidoreductase subunit E
MTVPHARPGCQCEHDEQQACRAILRRLEQSYEGRPTELIPMMQEAQKELGYLPEVALLEIARLTGLPAASVFGVATFYTQFRLQPVGRHIIKICTGTACHVRGSHRILKDTGERFDVEPGQTTADRLFTLETVACFGACALAPVVVMGEAVSGRMNASRARQMLEDLRCRATDPGITPPPDRS